MSDFDRIREEGERISREEGYKVLLAEIAARDKEIERLRGSTAEQRFCEPTVAGSIPAAGFLTDAEQEAVERAIGWIESPGVEDEAMPDDYLPITAALRGLLARCAVSTT